MRSERVGVQVYNLVACTSNNSHLCVLQTTHTSVYFKQLTPLCLWECCSEELFCMFPSAAVHGVPRCAAVSGSDGACACKGHTAWLKEVERGVR